MFKISLHLVDYIIIVVFLVVTLVVGFMFARRQNSLKSFFLARRAVSKADSIRGPAPVHRSP